MTKDKHSFIDPSTVAAIVQHGSDKHRTELLNDHQLDSGQVSSVKSNYSYEHWDKVISRPHLSDREKLDVAVYSTLGHVSSLLKHHQVRGEALHYIARHGTYDHKSELLNNHRLDDEAKYRIAVHGRNQHRDQLIDHHQPLDDRTKQAIGFHGNSRKMYRPSYDKK